jgi:hypothetical protein
MATLRMQPIGDQNMDGIGGGKRRSSSIESEEVMLTLKRLAQQYGADMNPLNGIIKFILPKEDKDNPAGRNVQIEINLKDETAGMKEVKN